MGEEPIFKMIEADCGHTRCTAESNMCRMLQNYMMTNKDFQALVQVFKAEAHSEDDWQVFMEVLERLLDSLVEVRVAMQAPKQAVKHLFGEGHQN